MGVKQFVATLHESEGNMHVFGDQTHYLRLTTVQNKVDIPKYSLIESVYFKAKVYQKPGKSSWGTSIRWVIGKPGTLSSDETAETIYNDKNYVYCSNAIGTTTSYADYQSENLVEYFNSGKENAGHTDDGLAFIRFYFTDKSAFYQSYSYYKDIQLIINYIVPDYVISTSVSPSGSGTVTGGGTYEKGKTATLTAEPNDGYKFVRWSDGNTNPTRTITVTANATYTAVFEKQAQRPVITDIETEYNGKINPTVIPMGAGFTISVSIELQNV